MTLEAAARVQRPVPQGSAAQYGPVQEMGTPGDLSRAESIVHAAGVAGGPLSNGRGGSALTVARMRHLQRTRGNHAVQQWVRGGGAHVQRDISLTDVVPDAILRPIRQLVDQVSDFTSGVTTRSDAAAAGAGRDAEAAATQADTEAGRETDAARAQGEGAAASASAQASAADLTGRLTQAGGEQQAQQLNNAVPAADYAADPVRPAVQPPPGGALPGVGVPVQADGAGQSWNCDEAAVLEKVSSVGRSVVQRLGRLVRSVVPEQVLQFAQDGIARLQRVIGGIRQKVEAAKRAVGEWVDNTLKPVRDLMQKAQTAVSATIDSAKRAVSQTLARLSTWAAAKWEALKGAARATVDGVVEGAKRGIGRLVDRAKDLAGRFWDMLPDAVKGPLAGAAAALAAPIVLAYKAVEAAAAAIERKAAALRQRLAAAADTATRWLATKYQQARTVVTTAGDLLARGAAAVRKKVADTGSAVYEGLDRLSGGRISKWRAAAAQRFAELKGEVCAITGAAAGPCVERFVPEPVGPEGKSFASLTTKADITVPIEGVPVKVAAGATVTIERTAKKYNVVLSGEGFAGVAVNLTGGGGGGGSASVTVDGSLPNKALALLSLGGQGPGLPGVPVPIGGAQTPATPATAPGTATPAAGPAAAAPGAGGGALSASAEAGRKVSVALTYMFDATADKTSCDGLGGLTAFLASQGAAALLPAPFSHLAAAGGQAAFSSRLRSAKITMADTGSVSAQVGKGGASVSGTVNVESGASVEAAVGDDNSRSLTATLFKGVSGELAVSFAPEGIGLGKLSGSLGGRQELSVTYNLTQDKLDAGFKQALTGTATLGTFAGMVGSLPAPVRERVRRMLACLPDANEASVSFELSSNIVNLAALAQALDGELNKGEAATAEGVWEAVSAFLRNKDNCYVEFSAKLTLTEKMLGIKASGSSGSGPDAVSGGAEVGLSRGQEIVLCPPTRLLQDGGGAAAPAAGAAAGGAIAGAAAGGMSMPQAPPAAEPQQAPRSAPLPFFHGSTWRVAQTIPGHVRPVGGGDFGQGFYTHHDPDTAVAAERARWEGCRLCQKLGPQERYAGVIRFDVAPAEYARITDRRNFNLTTTTQPDYAARQKEWLDFVSGPGRGREACAVFDPAHMSWRHQRVDPPPDQGPSLMEGPMYKGVEGLPGSAVPPRSAFHPYAEGTALPQQVVWNHDQSMAVLNATPTSLKQFDAANGCAPVDPPAGVAGASAVSAADEARAREAAQAELTGG